MTAVTTVQYALEAVYEALTEDLTADVTKPRALAATDLFRRGMPRGVDPSVRGREAKVGKTAFVALGNLRPDPGFPTEMHDAHLWLMTFSVSLDYHLGFEYSVSDVEATFVTVADDVMKVTAALCYPMALSQTVAANPTGLAGVGALQRDGIQATVAVDPSGGRSRLVNSTINFVGAIEFDPDA